MNNGIATQLSRRDLIRASAAAAVAAALASTPMTIFAQSAGQDLQILNYALTLEHLEARAYKDANGSGLLSGTAAKYFTMFGAHEATHVTALTDTINKLGGSPVKAQDKYNFPAFKSQNDILTYFQTVEELGAAAYLGQAPRLQNPDVLTAAVSIHNVEAQHAAVLSDLIGVSPAPAFGTPKTMDQVLAVVGPILAAAPAPAGGGSTTTPPNTMPTTGVGTGVEQLVAEVLGGAGLLGAGLLLRRNRARTVETREN